MYVMVGGQVSASGDAKGVEMVVASDAVLSLRCTPYVHDSPILDVSFGSGAEPRFVTACANGHIYFYERNQPKPVLTLVRAPERARWHAVTRGRQLTLTCAVLWRDVWWAGAGAGCSAHTTAR
jgi:hypothetical protein